MNTQGHLKIGLMAERLGKGLQNLVQRFDSASDLPGGGEKKKESFGCREPTSTGSPEEHQGKHKDQAAVFQLPLFSTRLISDRYLT